MLSEDKPGLRKRPVQMLYELLLSFVSGASLDVAMAASEQEAEAERDVTGASIDDEEPFRTARRSRSAHCTLSASQAEACMQP